MGALHRGSALVLQSLCGWSHPTCAGFCWLLLCSQCMDIKQPVITCNAAPAVKRPNHLHCSSLFHFSCNGEQPGIPTTLHKHFVAKDQTEWSPGPLGSLSDLGSQPLLDDQWSNGISSQFTLDGTQGSQTRQNSLHGTGATTAISSTERKPLQITWN